MSNTHDVFFCAQGLKKIWHNAAENFVVEFSLEALSGSMTAIVGPSGSGKSTVLNLIAGLVEPEENYMLTLDGKDISRLAPGKRGIGMVFQNPALFSHLRVEDNIAYGLKCRGISRKVCRSRASHWLTKVGLAGFEKRFPETLSGGEAHRVSLARTLITSPRLILFDEPLASLDAPLQKKLIAEIAALKQETGFTGILVTHNIAEARALCNRIVHMESGRVVHIEEV